MANEKNLKPFKKGQSGNPKGRPKGSLNRSTIVSRWLSTSEEAKNPITGDKESMSQEDIITLALIKKARNGDTQAYKALMDSGYGLPKQEIEQLNINTEAAITINHEKKPIDLGSDEQE